MSKRLLFILICGVFASATPALALDNTGGRCTDIRAEIYRLGGVLANHSRRFERWVVGSTVQSDFVRENRMIWLNGALSGARVIAEEEMPKWLRLAQQHACLEPTQILLVQDEVVRSLSPMLAFAKSRANGIQESGVTGVRRQ